MLKLVDYLLVQAENHGITNAFIFVSATLLTDPNVVQDLLREEESKTRGLVEKYSIKMKNAHVSTTHTKAYCKKSVLNHFNTCVWSNSLSTNHDCSRRHS